jgi:hypothetical protein
MTHRRPYMLPPLLAGVECACSAGNIDFHCREAIRTAWREGKPSHEGASIKAARDSFRTGTHRPKSTPLCTPLWPTISAHGRPLPSVTPR